MTKRNVRLDIQGLRAIAVIAVVVFHFNHAWLPGGFAGVDVFFVISGFLMTMIIFNGLEKNTFSILRFYQARVKRIMPALIALCLALLVFGFFFINPLDYLNVGKHIAASLSFTSNIIYWTESGYFDNKSIEKWLLHTWSLSVEWQFYLIYPAVLVALQKFLSLNQIKATLCVTAILGLLLSIIGTHINSEGAYFLLPTRAWQMLAGGIVFIYPIKLTTKAQNAFCWVGLTLIGLSLFIFSDSTPWPGYASLLPIIGTCFVLIANQRVSFWFSNSVTQQLGKWSYSIYLWHWPVVVANQYFSFSKNWWMLGIPLSVALGALSFTFIESKKLSDYHLRKLKVIFSPLRLGTIITLSALVVFMTDGIANRFSDEMRFLMSTAKLAKKDWYYPEPNLEINSLQVRRIEGESEKNILVLGASHIEQIYPYVESLNSKYNTYFLTEGGCFVTPSMENPKWSCENLQNYQRLLKDVKFEKVVTSFYGFDAYLPLNPTRKNELIAIRINEYDQFLEKLRAHSEHVYLLLGEPKGEEFDPILSIRLKLNDKISEQKARGNYVLHQAALAQLMHLDNIQMIDPIEFLCEKGICKTRDAKNGYYYKDYNHMRPWYAIEKLKYLDHIFLDFGESSQTKRLHYE